MNGCCRSAVDLIRQHSSWRERLGVLRHAPFTAVPYLLRAAFAPLPTPSNGVICEIPSPGVYDNCLTKLAGYLGRPAPPVPAQRPGLNRLLAHHRDCSGAIGLGDLLFLHAFVSVAAPQRTVEIGTLAGFSAAVIADAVAQHERGGGKATLLNTIDLNERCLTDPSKPVGFQIPQLVPQLSDHIRVHPGKDASYLQEIASPGELDVVFIDADHQHPRPTLDLVRVAPFVRPAGWIIVHDIDLGSLGERMRAAGHVLDHGAPFGAQWLFEAWPFDKISGGNIGALRLPQQLRQLVPWALAMLRIPSELKPTSAQQTTQALLRALADLT